MDEINVLVIKDASLYMRGGEIDVYMILSSLEPGKAAYLSSAPYKGSNIRLLIYWDEKRDFDLIIGNLIEILRTIKKKGEQIPDLALVVSMDIEYQIERGSLEAILQSAMGEIPRFFKNKKIRDELNRIAKSGYVCSVCPLNPGRILDEMNDPFNYAFVIIPALKNASQIESEKRLSEVSVKCFDCVTRTVEILKKGIKKLPNSTAFTTRKVEYLERSTWYLPLPKKYDVIHEIPTPFGIVRVIRPYKKIGGKWIRQPPMIYLPSMSRAERTIYNAVTNQLVNMVSSRTELLDIYIADKDKFMKMIARMTREVLAKLDLGEKVSKESLTRVIRWIMELKGGSGYIAPLLSSVHELQITDINMIGRKPVTIRTIKEYDGYTVLQTNLILSEDDINSIALSLAERNPVSRTIKGVLETTFKYRVKEGMDPLIIRVSLVREPLYTSANLRIMLPTGFYHFIWKYRNMSPEVLAYLAAMFPYLSVVFLGEPGAIKSTLAHLLLLSLKARTEVNYIAESHEMPTDIPELVINPLTIETDIEISTTRKTREDVLKVGLRRRADIVLIEEIRDTNMLSLFLRESAIKNVVTTVHAKSPEDFIKRFSLKGIDPKEFTVIDLLVQMQKYKVGNAEKFVVEGIYHPTIKRGKLIFEKIAWVERVGDDIEWKVIPPEEVVKIFETSFRRRNLTPEKFKMFVESVIDYLEILGQFKDKLDNALSPFSPFFRNLDREVCIVIHEMVDTNMSREERKRAIMDIVKNRLASVIATTLIAI